MDVGRALAEARVAASLTVDDVAEATRLRASVVTAMEANDHAASGPAFARMYVRSIARALHLDPEPLLAQMDAPESAPESYFEAQYRDVQEGKRRPGDWRARTPQLIAFGAVLLLAVVAGYVFMTRDEGTEGLPAPSVSSTTAATSEPSSTATTKPTTAPTTKPATSDTATVTPTHTFFVDPAAGAATDSIALTVSAKTATWILVRGTNGVLWKGVLDAGSTADFAASTKITVSTRDASALSINANGTDFLDFGEAGQSLNLAFRLH